MKITYKTQISEAGKLEEYKAPAVTTSESAAAIDNLLETFGGTWPPKPEFSDWPTSWLPFQRICDDMSAHLLGWNNPEKFREYLREQFDNHINLDAVMADIEARTAIFDPKLLGFLGCLAVLKNAYRWGSLPVTPEEQARTTLTFPELLDTPATRISNHYGVAPLGHVFSLIFANTMYDPEDSDLPVHTRFHFNVDELILETEENFYIVFTHSEIAFHSALLAMRDFMELTAKAKQSKEQALALLDRRVDLLKTIRSAFLKVGKVFMSYATEKKIREEYWSHYAQNPTAWGLDGNGGASGGENIVFQTLDEFLEVPGECLMYKSKPLRRAYMPSQMRDILKALNTEMAGSRFESFLGHTQGEDPVLAAKDAILNAVYLWRLNHAHVAKRYLKRCDMLSSSLDKKMDLSQTLAEVTYDQLRTRAREVSAQITKNKNAKDGKVKPAKVSLADVADVSQMESHEWGSKIYNTTKSVFSTMGQVLEYVYVAHGY